MGRGAYVIDSIINIRPINYFGRSISYLKTGILFLVGFLTSASGYLKNYTLNLSRRQTVLSLL